MRRALRSLLLCAVAALLGGCTSASDTNSGAEGTHIPDTQYIRGPQGVMGFGRAVVEGTLSASCSAPGAVAQDLRMSGTESGPRFDRQGAGNVTLSFVWEAETPALANLTFQVLHSGGAAPGLDPRLPFVTASSPAVWKWNATMLDTFDGEFTVYALLPRDCPAAGARDVSAVHQVVAVQALLRNIPPGE